MIPKRSSNSGPISDMGSPSRHGRRASLLLLCLLTGCISAPAQAEDTKAKNDEYRDFNHQDDNKVGASSWTQTIKVLSPAYRADVTGDVTVEFEAPGMKRADARCWQQPTDANKSPEGHDQVVAGPMKLSDDGKGSFVFKAAEFPYGPTNIRIFARSDQGKQDICELQLYNTAGVKWNQGLPKDPPPAAKGMKVAFVDEFDKMPTISSNGKDARYCAHKPGGGDFSGWQFADPQGEGLPFKQRDTYLIIHANKEKDKKMSGLISTVAMDGSGYWAKPPFYMECRFTAQSAPGTWPAFWTLTKKADATTRPVTDELDIVEAYGGVGRTLKGEPTPGFPGYSVTSHFWNQFGPDGVTKRKAVNNRIDMSVTGNKSDWSTTFHTYGLYVDEKDTVYYLDNIEVFRHPTNPTSMLPHIVMINYAIGGISGWKSDLERYGNASDMYIDFVRVWEKN